MAGNDIGTGAVAEPAALELSAASSGVLIVGSAVVAIENRKCVGYDA